MALNYRRIGLLISFTSLIVLGASLYTWANGSSWNRIFYSVDEYEWVHARASDLRAIKSDEIWRLQPECARPILQTELDKFEFAAAKHLEAKPIELKRYEALPPLKVQADTTDYYTEKSRRTSEYVAILTEHNRWFGEKSLIDSQIQATQQTLNGLKEIRHLRSDVTVLSTAPALVLSRFGVNALREEAVAPLYACIQTIPIKMVVSSTSYHSDLSRWPADQPWLFWPSFVLLLVGPFLRNLVKWLWSR